MNSNTLGLYSVLRNENCRICDCELKLELRFGEESWLPDFAASQVIWVFQQRAESAASSSPSTNSGQNQWGFSASSFILVPVCCCLSPKPPAPGSVRKICTPPVQKSLKVIHFSPVKGRGGVLLPGHARTQNLERFCSSICSICSCSAGRHHLPGQLATATLRWVWSALEVNPASFTLQFCCKNFSNPLKKMSIYIYVHLSICPFTHIYV